MNQGFGQQGQEHAEAVVDIALCICPHLRELLVVDQRKHLPGRPLIQVLHTDTVFDEEFYQEVEQQFSYALRQKKHPITTMIALPQVIEAVVRQRSLQSILGAVNDGVIETTTPRVSILLFSGETLNLDEEELTQTMQDLLGSERDEETMAMAQRSLAPLLAQEREFEHQVEQDWLRRVIRGSGGDFFTLWQQSP